MSNIQLICLGVLWAILLPVDLIFFCPESDLDWRSPVTWLIWFFFILIVVIPIAAVFITLIAGCFGVFG